MKKLLFFTLVLLLCDRLRSQNAVWQPATREEVVDAYKSVWSWFVGNSSYEFRLRYASYKGHQSNEVLESSEGYYKRSGTKYKTECVGIKTIQNEKVKIIVDTADKMIALTNPGTLSLNMVEAADLIRLLDNVKALRKRAVRNSVQYRIEFRKNELYEAYEFTVNKDNMLDKLVYYYAEQTEKDYGDGDVEAAREWKIKPRLEIDFSNYLVPSRTAANEFTDNSIILTEGKKVSLAGKYRSFVVKDYRFEKK
jgi:hypothetical protein